MGNLYDEKGFGARISSYADPNAEIWLEASHAESLVQVQVADIRSAGGWRSQTNHGIQVCSIEVHLPSVIVNDLAGMLNLSEWRHVSLALGASHQSQTIGSPHPRTRHRLTGMSP